MSSPAAWLPQEAPPSSSSEASSVSTMTAAAAPASSTIIGYSQPPNNSFSTGAALPQKHVVPYSALTDSQSTAVAQGSSASNVLQTVPLLNNNNNTPLSFSAPISSNQNSGPPPLWGPTNPYAHVPPGNHVPPGSHIPGTSYLGVQQPMRASYPPQGIWIQAPPMGGIPRTPFLPYPSVYPGSFPPPAQNVMHPSIQSFDSQPPGVFPLVKSTASPLSSAIPGHQLIGSTTEMQTELPPGIGDKKHDHSVASMDGASQNVWTAFKSGTGHVYYYNAITGESTYVKPPGFKGEPDKVPVQPTPVLMEHLAGTDWVLVATNDGKKYYYNNKTKISSWQIPSEVAELRKKQETDLPKEHLAPVHNIYPFIEKGAAPVSLNAPAVNTGGRDSMALRPTHIQGTSSALDLIKRKLQDPGAPLTSSAAPTSSVSAEQNDPKAAETTVKGVLSDNKDKPRDTNGDGNLSDSSSDSEDEETGPTKEECIIKFKAMLKERGVAPFSKWEKELPKILFDPRFKANVVASNMSTYVSLPILPSLELISAIPSHAARRSLFDHYVKTRAEEERKEKRAAQKAAIEGFKQLLEEASEDINQKTDYQTFRKKWGSDPRFEALDRKDRELLLNESASLFTFDQHPVIVLSKSLDMLKNLGVLSIKRAAEEKAHGIRVAAASNFKSMLRERVDITVNSRWSKVKDSLRNDPRYKSVRHEDREIVFNEYLSELMAVEGEADREAKAKREEQEKLKERERELRKRKERDEQEMERVRLKVRRKEAVTSFQALLVETIKVPQASWTESKLKLEKDPQGRANNPDLDSSDAEKLFREHVKMVHERCAKDFKSLLREVLTAEAATKETEDGKTILNSWSTAKRYLKSDPRYNKMPRKDREALWRQYTDDMARKQKPMSYREDEKYKESRSRS
ncbi:hypothetical protein ACFE04_030170 [Oxalis oulophora]